MGKGANSRMTISVDYKKISIALLILIVLLIALWRPWQTHYSDKSRVISVTGQTTISATPDEYIFYPSYQISDSDNETALNAMTTKSEEVVAGLKKLGVSDKKIKTDSNGYDNLYISAPEEDQTTYTLNLTVSVSDRKLAQKVQDYLLTTTPTGNVTPQASFSDKKRTSLESSARDAATKDARKKADQMATNLGFKVGAVKSVADDNGFNAISPYVVKGSGLDMAVAPERSSTSLSLQPGENELDYSVTVTYYIR